jgi:hypothetical protein
MLIIIMVEVSPTDDLTPMKIKTTILLNVTPCSLVDI